MNLKHIKDIVIPILEELKLSLYSLKTKKEDNLSILEIVVDGQQLDVDLLGMVNQRIHKEIGDFLPDEYYLEVASPGLERELKTLEEVNEYIDSYIYFKTTNIDHEGTLIKVEGNTLFIKVNLKGRFKTFEVPYEDIQYIRLAVKF